MTTEELPAVDFHCHLDLYPDFPRIVAECQQANVATLAVTTTPFAYPRNIEAAANFPLIFPSLGLHPQIVGEKHASAVEFLRLLPSATFVGEVGLDAGPRFYKTYPEQKRLFRDIIRACSDQGGKVLSLHSARSAKDILEILEEFKIIRTCQVVFHWFSGSDSEMARAIEMGCYFSINAAMLSKSARAESLKRIPANRILTETDGPFIDDSAGSPLRPKSIHSLLPRLASLLGQRPETLRRQIWSNLKCLQGAAL